MAGQRKNQRGALPRGKKHQPRSLSTQPTKNRFRFRNFGEQIESISFDKVRRYGSRRGETPGSHLPTPQEGESWFGLALLEWRELNCTAPFAAFVHEVQRLCGSLAQVLFYRDDIIAKLVEHMNDEKSTLAVAPLSALTAALVRDLGEEVVPHFAPLFAAMIGLLGRAVDVESMEVVLGSLFFFVKNLAPEVAPSLIINHLVSALQIGNIRPQVQDFLVEFASFVLGRSFDEGLVEILFKGLGGPKRDLCVAIIAGSLDTATSNAKKTRTPLCEGRLKMVLALLDTREDAFEMTKGLLSSLIDRVGPSATWSLVAKVVGGRSSAAFSGGLAVMPLDVSPIDPSHILSTIPEIARVKRGRLIAEHSSLIASIIALAVDPSLVQQALVAIARHCALDVLLMQRAALQSLFLGNSNGIALLVLEVPHLVEPLVGSVNAAKKLAEAITSGHFALLAIFDKLVRNVSGNPSLLAQVLCQVPVDTVHHIAQEGTLGFKLQLTALSLLGQIPSVTDCALVDSLLRASCPVPINMRLALLRAGKRFISGQRNATLTDFLKPLLHHSSALELLHSLSPPDGHVEVNLLLPTLMSSDSHRRLLVLQLLERTHLSSSSLLGECLALERVPWDFNCDRDKGLRLQAIGNILKHVNASSKAASLEVELVARHLTGVLLHGFQRLKKELWLTLSILVEHHAGIAKTILLSALHRLSSFERDPATDDLPDGSFEEAPFFSELCVAPFFAFFAHRPATSDLVITGLLPVIAQALQVDCPLAPSAPVSAWFSRSVQGSLESVLTAMSGMRSINGDVKLKSAVSTILHHFLCAPDASIQRSALDSIISLGLYEGIGLYVDRLRRLLSDTEMRDELVLLAAEQGDMLSAATWSSLCPLLIHLLYGRMVARKNVGAGRNSMVSRRKMILNYIVTWNVASLHEFVLFLGLSAAGIDSTNVKTDRIIGFLTLLQTVLAKIGRKITRATVDQILSWLQRISEHVASTDLEASSEGKKIRRLLLKRLYDVYSICPTTMDLSEWTERSWRLVAPRVSRLESEFVQGSSTLLDLLYFWTSDARYFESIALGVGAAMWPRLAASLGVEDATNDVMLKILDIFQIILAKALDASHVQASTVLSSLVAPLSRSLNTRVSVILAAPRKNADLLDRVVEMLLKMSSLIQDDEEQKTLLISSLLQLLPLKKGLNEESKTRMLQLAAVLYAPALHQPIYEVACGLLSTLRERPSRFALAQLFAGLARRDESLQLFAQVLDDLHAPSPDRIGEYDYDRQCEAFGRLRRAAQQEGALSGAQWVPILQSMLYFCHDAEDTAARSQAFSIVAQFVRRVAQEEETWYPLLQSQLYPALKRGLKSEAEVVRVEFLSLLNQLVTTFAAREPFSALSPLLSNGNEDANVLLNLLHLQQHRRTRALKRLTEYARSLPALDRSVIEDIFFPLLDHFVRSDPKARDPVPLPVVHEAIMAMAALGALLPPRVIVLRTTRLVALIKRGTPAEKALLKLIPAILGEVREERLDEGQIKTLLGMLFDLLLAKADVIRTPMAVAIAALLRTSSDATLQSIHLPKLVSTLSLMMVNRRAERREEAREAIAAVLERLGVEQHLMPMLRELRSALSGGYRPHLLAFTLHHILAKTRPPVEALAEAAETIMSIIIDDVFGPGAEEKDAKEWTGRMAEIKAKKSPDSLGLLVANLPPSKLLGKVLLPLRTATSQSTRAEAIDSVCKAVEEGLFQQISPAMATDQLSQLLPMLYSLLDSTGSFYSTDAGIPGMGPNWSRHASRFQLIAGRVLLHLLKQQPIRSQISALTLAQLLPLLLTHIQGPSAPLIATAVKCLVPLLGALESLPTEVSEGGLLGRLFSLVITSDTHRHSDLIAACFRLIATLVRDRDDVQLTEQQLKALLSYIRNNLESDSTAGSSATSTAYILIRSILRRQILLPEVYELMRVIQRTMLRSFQAPVRQQCRVALLTFLLSYPLARPKLEEHFSFLIANLSYEADGGRESVALFLGSLLERVPAEVVRDLGESVLVALTARLANEENERTRQAVEDAIRKTVARLDERGMDRCALLLERWLTSSSAAVQRTVWMLAPLLIRSATVPVTRLVSLLVSSMDREQPSSDMLSTLLAIVERCPSPAALDVIVHIAPHSEDDLRMLRGRLLGEYFAILAPHLALTDDEDNHRDVSSSHQEAVQAHQVPAIPTIIDWSHHWLKDLRSLSDPHQVAAAEQIVKNLIFVARLLANHRSGEETPLAQPKRITTLTALLEKVEKMHRQLATGTAPLFVRLPLSSPAMSIHRLLGLVDAKIFCRDHPWARVAGFCPRQCPLHADHRSGRARSRGTHPQRRRRNDRPTSARFACHEDWRRATGDAPGGRVAKHNADETEAQG